MRVVIVENENFKEHRIGGISSYIKAMTKLGVENETEIICIGHGFNSSRIDNVNYISTGSGDFSNFRFFIGLLWRNFGKYFDQDTIVHVHHPYICIPFLRYRKKIKLVLTLHSKQDQSFRENKNVFLGILYDTLTRWSFKYYDIIIADNMRLLQYYQKKFGIKGEKSIVIHPPVDVNVFKPLDRKFLRKNNNLFDSDKVILFAGRIEKEKNLELLLKSFELLSGDIQGIKLWIAGEGSQLNMIKQLALELGLTGITFFQTLLNDQLAGLMNCTDVFALTSLHEGGPMVVKEALACNLPVVTVDVGDVAELTKDLKGCFISSYDKYDFTGKLRKAVEYNGDKNYRYKVMGFGVEDFGKKVLEVYKSINLHCEDSKKQSVLGIE